MIEANGASTLRDLALELAERLHAGNRNALNTRPDKTVEKLPIALELRSVRFREAKPVTKSNHRKRERGLARRHQVIQVPKEQPGRLRLPELVTEQAPFREGLACVRSIEPFGRP